MGYTWNSIIVGQNPTRANFQQVVNRVHDVEDNVLHFEDYDRLMQLYVYFAVR